MLFKYLMWPHPSPPESTGVHKTDSQPRRGRQRDATMRPLPMVIPDPFAGHPEMTHETKSVIEAGEEHFATPRPCMTEATHECLRISLKPRFVVKKNPSDRVSHEPAR